MGRHLFAIPLVTMLDFRHFFGTTITYFSGEYIGLYECRVQQFSLLGRAHPQPTSIDCDPLRWLDVWLGLGGLDAWLHAGMVVPF